MRKILLTIMLLAHDLSLAQQPTQQQQPAQPRAQQKLEQTCSSIKLGEIKDPPSMMASALSRDTKSVRAARACFFSFFPERIFSLSCISTKARFVNLAVESGSTNHLFGHRTTDHDSFFRRRDRSREQGAQSA